MRCLREVSAALLLALVATAALLPLAASRAERHGCHCPVRMACCEKGTCTMGRDEPPASGPEWRTCRRETPATAASPLDAFGQALTDSASQTTPAETGRVADGFTVRPCPAVSVPEPPPPRLFSF